MTLDDDDLGPELLTLTEAIADWLGEIVEAENLDRHRALFDAGFPEPA